MLNYLLSIAGKIVGDIARATGANGGGRPNFAQGGIKDASKLDEILNKVESELNSSNGRIEAQLKDLEDEYQEKIRNIGEEEKQVTGQL